MTTRITQDTEGLTILAVDGGGIRGLSSLIILRNILYRVQQAKRLKTMPLPCEVFSIITGTSTGGLIALMLGRLRMSIAEAIDAYQHIVTQVFSDVKHSGEGKFKASKLETTIKAIVKWKTGHEDALLMDTSAYGCPTFVCAMNTMNMNARIPQLFRTYPSLHEEPMSCTIWQAARATSATPTFFRPIKIGTQWFVDGGIANNNPTLLTLDEANQAFPGRHVACILSLGTGKRDTISIPRNLSMRANYLPPEVIKAMQDIASDCEHVHEQTAHRYANYPGVYFRLNVEQGLQSVSLSEWEKLDAVEAHTRQYLKLQDVEQKLPQVTEVLKACAGHVLTDDFTCNTRSFKTRGLGHRHLDLNASIELILVPSMTSEPMEEYYEDLDGPNASELDNPAQPMSESRSICERELLTDLLEQHILSSDKSIDDFPSLDTSTARQFLTLLEKLLHSCAINLGTKQHRRAHRLLKKIAAENEVLPSSFYISNVTREDGYPIAGGGYSDIYRGSLNGRAVCLKVLKSYLDLSDEQKTKTKKSPSVQDFYHEALIWRQLEHPNLLPFIGVSEDCFPERLCFVSPFMKHRDIMRFISEHPDYNRLLALFEVASGLSYLHDMGIRHGDLKGLNILVDDTYHCQLADFGISSIAASQTATVYSSTMGMKGSSRWMAPEMIFPDDYPGSTSDFKTDIYAFGCTMLEVCTGEVPWAGVNEPRVIHLIYSGKRPPRPEVHWISDEVWELIEQCWQDDACSRPSANEVVAAFSQI